MTKLVSILFLLSLFITADSNGPECLFYDKDGRFVFRIDPSENEVWEEDDLIALRLTKKKAQEILNRRENLIDGTCRMINHKKDTFAVPITGYDFSLRPCITVIAKDSALWLFAGNIMIDTKRSGCELEFEDFRKFLQEELK